MSSPAAGGPLQVLCDCPHCRVESAMVELVDAIARMHHARCRMCGLELSSGTTVAAGRVFTDAGAVEQALAAWAHEEGEPVEGFVAANFSGLNAGQVADAVLAGARVRTSFDVVAWLFRSRTAGAVALGSPGGDTHAAAARGDGDGAPERPDDAIAGPAMPAADRTVAHRTVRPPPDPRVVTRALVATALADGRVEPAERTVLDKLCARLEAPLPTEDDWRAWRPLELGDPPDPAATVKAMIVLALADKIPDLGEERVIREFARAWRVPLPDPVLPPVTVPQKLSAAWLGLFSR